MREQIIELIKKYPKLFTRIIKRDKQLLAWVSENTLIESSNFAAQVYSAIHQASNFCENQREKKFVSINLGFAGCGRAAVCACVRASTSLAVSKTKSLITPEQKQVSNEKRRKTNLEKYGVVCTAQTPEAIQKMRDYYADPVKVAAQLERIKSSYREKYGVENCRQLPEVNEKILATLLARYGVSNIAQIPSTKAKLRARMAEYKVTGYLINKGYDRFSKYIETEYDFKLITPRAQYQGMEKTPLLEFSCNTCNTTVMQKFYYGRGLRCDVCNPRQSSFTSLEEQAVFDYIQTELGISGYQSDKSIIAPLELDMVFPALKIAVEYSGLYWHSEASSGKNRTYHYHKMLAAREQGYRLITIFSDEWLLNTEVVKSKLRNIFGKTTQRYYARKTQVKQLSHAEATNFLNQHHMQGAGSAQIKLGLTDPATQTLLAVMTFSPGRAALNTKKTPGEYELVRFATNGTAVVGGAGKLLSYFVKTHKPARIISYADLRWSQGNVYTKLGFTTRSEPTIGYWYVDGYQKRLHRFNFTKRQLVREGADPGKTEWEIMQGLGYDRIWDCGHQKYVLDIQ